MCNHTDILNLLASKFNLRSYLEVGLRSSDDNFDLIICPIKTSVDINPQANPTFAVSSDEFYAGNKERFDLQFIDGDHTEYQSYRDICNAINCMEDEGYVLCHDCNPTTMEMQAEPRQQSEYTGTVWRAWVRLRQERNDLSMFVIDTDYGCGVICKGKQMPLKTTAGISYTNFEVYKTSWLNLISVSQFYLWLNQKQ